MNIIFEVTGSFAQALILYINNTDAFEMIFLYNSSQKGDVDAEIELHMKKQTVIERFTADKEIHRGDMKQKDRRYKYVMSQRKLMCEKCLLYKIFDI